MTFSALCDRHSRPSRSWRGSVVILCLAGSAWGQQAWGALADDIAVCRSIADAAPRLACYDGLLPPAAPAAPAKDTPEAAKVNARVAAPPPASVPAAAAPMAGTPAPAEQGFGGEMLAKSAGETSKSLHAHVVGSVDGLRRGQLLRLDNGQVWRSVDDNEYSYEADNPSVSIDRNFTGNYWMHLEQGAFNLRVSRVQ